MQMDLVVVGSGAAGLTAATVAAKGGLSVLVLESASVVGGTTAFSGGALWIPGNRYFGDEAERNSVEAFDYLRAVLGNSFNEAKVRTYLKKCTEMLSFMEENTEVRLLATTVHDYGPSLPGASAGRTLMPAPYDGKRLGRDFARLRRAIPEMGLFRSMQIPHVDIMRLQGWNASPRHAWDATSLVLRYAWDRVRHGRGTRLGNGNALAGRLLKSALDAGVTIRTNTPARSLVFEQGRVAGVICESDGKEETVKARLAVVLASGGCGGNEAMRREHVPLADAGWSLQPESCRGDGLNMGIAAGGHLVKTNAGNGIWTPASSHRRADGSLALFPSLMLDRHCPGSIMVDAATGERFVNESESYHHLGTTAIARNIPKAYIISDADAVARYGLGMVKPWPLPVKPWVKRGYVVEASDVGELAAKIGIDPKVLQETVAKFNRGAEAGVDPDFKRGEDPYSASNGDPSHQPNPALGPLVKAPFYALEVRPSDLSVLIGLETNVDAQVLDESGAPIPGLYAAGLDNNTVFSGHYPGGGASLGPAMTFGYVAAQNIVSDRAS